MPSDLPDFDLEAYLPYRFTIIAGQMSDALAREYKQQFGISMPEWRVLVNVGYTRDLSVRDIEIRVRLEKSKVSRAVSKLEAKGYLTKVIHPQDRRLLKLALTDEGIALLRDLIPIAQRLQDDLIARLGAHEAGFVEALNALSRPEGNTSG